LELDPHYTFAGNALFDELFDAGEDEEAGEVIDRLQKDNPDDPYVVARAVTCAARHRDLAAALDGLRRLCVATDPNDCPLNHAAQVLTAAGWADRADRVLAEALDQPNVHRRVAELWMDRRLAGLNWHGVEQRLGTLPDGSEAGRQVLHAYVGGLA